MASPDRCQGSCMKQLHNFCQEENLHVQQIIWVLTGLHKVVQQASCMVKALANAICWQMLACLQATEFTRTSQLDSITIPVPPRYILALSISGNAFTLPWLTCIFKFEKWLSQHPVKLHNTWILTCLLIRFTSKTHPAELLFSHGSWKRYWKILQCKTLPASTIPLLKTCAFDMQIGEQGHRHQEHQQSIWWKAIDTGSKFLSPTRQHRR